MLAAALNMLVSLWSVTFFGYPIPPTVIGYKRAAGAIALPLIHWQRGSGLVHFWQKR